MTFPLHSVTLPPSPETTGRHQISEIQAWKICSLIKDPTDAADALEHLAKWNGLTLEQQIEGLYGDSWFEASYHHGRCFITIYPLKDNQICLQADHLANFIIKEIVI